MTPDEGYATGLALRTGLEQCLKRVAREQGIDLQRLRRQVAFDRFLARLFSSTSEDRILKGGYAMELRFQTARATRDLNFTARTTQSVTGDGLLKQLQDASARDAGDFFRYQIGEAIMDLDGAPYGGARYPVESIIGGRTFVKFHLDVGVGDVVLDPPELAVMRDWRGFAGIAAPDVPMIQREQQFAEKLHAYTLPRATLNSRVRDLVDMVLLIQSGTLEPGRVVQAVDATFGRRATHSLPAALTPPPDEWRSPFVRLAAECSLELSVSEALSSSWNSAQNSEDEAVEDFETVSEQLARVVAECERLREENTRLSRLLSDHSRPANVLEAELSQPLTSDRSVTAVRTPQSSGPVELPVPEKIALFRSLFRGREDVYALRWESADGKAGYSPASIRDWKAVMSVPQAERKKLDQATRQLLPLTDDAVYHHLSGKKTIGVYPLLADETCCFLAVHFDQESWKLDAVSFVESCREMNVPAAPERSRSGEGAHVWIFFSAPVPAILARKLGAGLVTRTMQRRHQISLKSYDRPLSESGHDARRRIRKPHRPSAAKDPTTSRQHHLC
jgi:hypothetical protein